MPKWAFDTLRQTIGAGFDRLGQEERVALATALIENDVTNTRMQDLVTDHPSDITKRLRGLVAKGWLETDNQRRWTRYRLPASLASRQDLFSTAIDNGGSRSSPLPTNSPHTDGDSTRTGGGSPHNGTASPRSGDQPTLTDDQLETLRPLADPISKQKRAAPAKLRKVILDLCEGRYLTADQLANLCNRDVDSLRERVLSKLAADGSLMFRHPDQPNHPNQAYTAAASAGGSAA